MDQLRKEIERCDKIEGVLLLNSFIGGTGTGLSYLIFEELTTLYPGITKTAFSIFPSSKESNSILEIYNGVLGISKILEISTAIFPYENEAISKVINRCLSFEGPSFNQINEIVSQTICGLTSPMRFPGFLNSSLLKTYVNLIPFPRMKLLTIRLAPLNFLNSNNNLSDLKNIINQLIDERNHLISFSQNIPTYLSSTAIFRGNFSPCEVENEFASYRKKKSANFVSWIDSNTSFIFCDKNKKDLNYLSSYLISNSTATNYGMKTLVDKFSKMFRRKCFLHIYTDEGMDEMEFTESESNFYDLLSEYNFENYDFPLSEDSFSSHTHSSDYMY